MNPQQARAPSAISTWAVVVLHHPQGDLAGRLERVMDQVAGLVVVSNDGQLPADLPGRLGPRIRWQINPRNLGLGAALNQGLAIAREHAVEWFLLLDQDSLVDADLVSGLAATWQSISPRGRIGILAPNYRSRAGGRCAYPVDVPWQRISTVVTSGSLVARAALDECGGMHEEFFIEGIDLEFCLRIRQRGWEVAASGRPLMTHGAGAAREATVLWRRVLVGDHPPWRCYLQGRNLTWTWRRYWRVDIPWAAKTLVSVAKRFVIICLAEDAAGPKMQEWLRGIGDGWRGVFPPPFPPPPCIV
jgi:rhamnosyltransferase